MSGQQSLRVLHVAPTPFFSDRGCHIRIEGIVKALNKQGVNSVVCTYHHGRDRPGVEILRINPIGRYQDTTAGPNSFKYLADLKLLWLVSRTMRRQRPDVIHAHLHEGILLGWAGKWIALRPRTPLVADIQGGLVGELESYGYFKNNNVLRYIFKKIEYVIIRMPQQIFCSSLSSRNLLARDYGLNGQRLALLSDRVDSTAFEAADTEHEGEQATVIYSGSLIPSKGLGLLLQVVERLLGKRPGVKVILVGYPVEETAEFLQRRGLAERCTLTGRVNYEDLPGYLQQADIGLDPKQADAGEGSGKILNYMAAGLAVVAYDSDNNREFLGPQQALVHNGSIEQFVERIEFLIDHPRLRQQEGERNRRRAEQEWTWDAGIDMVLRAYRKLRGANPQVSAR